MKLEFRLLGTDDLSRVERWLREEHVALWWRDPVDVVIEKWIAGI